MNRFPVTLCLFTNASLLRTWMQRSKCVLNILMSLIFELTRPLAVEEMGDDDRDSYQLSTEMLQIQ
jgi:hypothetical protein